MRPAPLGIPVLAAALILILPAATALLPAPEAALPAPGGTPLSLSDVFAQRNPQLVHRNHEVEAALKGLASEFPDLVEYGTHGTSFLQFPIHHACISAQPEGAGPGYDVYLDGGHHGNEFLGVEMVMMAAYFLVDNYGADDAVTHLLDNGKVCVTPIVNPDGNYLDTRKNGNQVDINRNYPYEFGLNGASDNPAALNYHGTGPLSEPETRANVAFAQSFMPDLWVTMHTGIAEMYWPWSYTNDDAPDAAFFESLEKPFEDASHGSLDAMQSAELYIAMGDTEDYGYGELGIPSFVIEVHGDQFMPAYTGGTFNELVDQFDGLKWLMFNVEKLGANIHVHNHPGVETSVVLSGDSATFWLHNKGFGDAYNATLTLSQGGNVLREESLSYLAAGQHLNFTFAGLDSFDALVLDIAYADLIIESSPMNHFTHEVAGDISPNEEPRAVPAPGAFGLVMAFAIVGLIAGRRLVRT